MTFRIITFWFAAISGTNTQQFMASTTGSLFTAEDIPLCGHAALRDTMTDLILDLVGSLLVAIFGLFYHDKAIEKYDILIKMMKIDNEE